jgi:4'-phosphopantetheinyl transferase
LRDVVVRWASVAGGPTDDEAIPERSRLAAMTDDDRRRFVGARRLLHRVVAEVTGSDDVVLHQRCERCGGPHGRPTVTVGGQPGPHVSMAHAGDLVVVAVASNPVGVDVEPGDDRGWVRLEAVLKATGHGLDVDPSLLDVDERGITRWDGPGPTPALRLVDLDLAPGYVAAVARLGRRRLSPPGAALPGATGRRGRAGRRGPRTAGS